MVMLSMCIITHYAVVFPVNKAIFQWKMMYHFFYKQTTYKGHGVHVVSPHVKIRPWRQSEYNCITILTSLLIEVRMVWQNKNKTCVHFVQNDFWSLFVYNRCRRCIFNKPTHLGNKTKRLSFLNMLIMHLFPSFTSKYWCLDVLEQHNKTI